MSLNLCLPCLSLHSWTNRKVLPILIWCLERTDWYGALLLREIDSGLFSIHTLKISPFLFIPKNYVQVNECTSNSHVWSGLYQHHFDQNWCQNNLVTRVLKFNSSAWYKLKRWIPKLEPNFPRNISPTVSKPIKKDWMANT